MRNLLGLRHGADLRSIATIVMTLIVLIGPQFIHLPGWLVLPWALAAFLLCCASHVVVHNHCHYPIFRPAGANRAFNLLATIARGHCVSDVFIAHNVVHHAEQGRAGDWIAPTLAGSGHPLTRLLRFIFRATLSMARERRALGARARALLPEPFRSSRPWEKRLLPCVIAALLWHDGWVTVAHLLLPWGASLAWLVGVNYVQHEDCDPESTWGHSRNFTGRFTNWWLFNNGFHSAHHLQPGLHWSEVGQLHAAIAHRVPSGLQQVSATRYMLRRFLFNREA